jgi:hypothetical protein
VIKLGLRILCKYIKAIVFDLGSKIKRLSDCGVHIEIFHILQSLSVLICLNVRIKFYDELLHRREIYFDF